MNILQKTIQICCLLIFLFSFVACSNEQSREEVFLERAREYSKNEDWANVIVLLQQFVASENKVPLDDRIEAWFLLAEATENIGQLGGSAEILELMLEDPDYSDEARVAIFDRLIPLYMRIGNYQLVAESHVRLIEYKEMEDDDVGDILLKAGINYQSLRNYNEADKVLSRALQLNVPSATKTEIYYYKGNGEAMLKKYDEALESLFLALSDHDLVEKSTNVAQEDKSSVQGEDQGTTSDIISGEMLGQIYYLIADIYDTQTKYYLAQKYYTKALDLYPNRLFVQKRIDYLNEHFTYEMEAQQNELEAERAKKRKK